LVIKGADDRAFVSGGDFKELSAIRMEKKASAVAWRARSRSADPTTVAQVRDDSVALVWHRPETD
jgi:enoyl-CoA hydratase/carnithine racemase